MANYIDLLEKELNRRGYVRDKENEALTKRKNGHSFSKEEHLKGFIFAQLSNQRPWEGIIPHFDDIDNIFCNYDFDEIRKHNGEYFEMQLKAISCGNRSIGAQMRGLHSNLDMFERIISKYGSLDKFVESMPAYEVVKKISDSSSEYKFIQLGEALAWEYIRNVGIDGAKPDLHMRKFYGSTMMGLSNHEMAPINVVLAEVDRLAKETGRTKFEIDYVIWTGMSQGIFSSKVVLDKLLNGETIKQTVVDDSKTVIVKEKVEVKKSVQKSSATGLYTYEEAVERMESAGLSRRHRADDFKLKYRQFGEEGSSLHVKTSRSKRFILYSTVSDFVNIKSEASRCNKEIIYLGTKDKGFDIQENNPNTIILIQNGNRILHNSAESILPHEILFFSNDSFDFIINVLAKNERNRG